MPHDLTFCPYLVHPRPTSATGQRDTGTRSVKGRVVYLTPTINGRRFPRTLLDPSEGGLERFRHEQLQWVLEEPRVRPVAPRPSTRTIQEGRTPRVVVDVLTVEGAKTVAVGS